MYMYDSETCQWNSMRANFENKAKMALGMQNKDTDLCISGKVTNFLIRGWVRKFCHRCYNFVNRHNRLLYYTLIERATCLLYNDAKRMHERNKYFKLDALKDTWGKTNSTFS